MKTWPVASPVRSIEKRFDYNQWQTLRTGAPALVNAMVSFDCEVRQVVPYQSHTIFLAEIVSVELWAEAHRPLVYLDGRYCSLAAQQQQFSVAS